MIFLLIIYAILSLAGINAEFEVLTNIGRIDCVIEFDKQIFIFEFKLDTPATAALKQIINKKYADKYKLRNKKIFIIGANIDTSQRNIGEYIIE
ncbi:MAG TPA: PD-(D/E)XK nuclease domain-containing protein [bacterium]|nr:PD-(D/E)XK nuclease domain-containing protein [bacterium]